MKDVVIDKVQIQAAEQSGADCVLLIESVFSKHHSASLGELMRFAHELNLEVLLEVHDREELGRALVSEADIIGVNNRSLETLEIDLLTTTRLLGDRDVLNTRRESFNRKPIISESGFETSADIRKLKQVVDGFLVGSSIMLSPDLKSKVRELVQA
jgi:indole-3-glycerol phosphate synthase